MAERLPIAELEGRRQTAAPSLRTRLSAANDNIPPVRYLVAKLAIAAGSFAATFAFALWWL